MRKVKKHKDYTRPPITEAVIEIRLKSPLKKTFLDKLHSKYRQTFLVQNLFETGIIFTQKEGDPTPVSESHINWLGYKLVDKTDSSNVLQFRQQSFTISRIAPYNGWKEFLTLFETYYSVFNKTNLPIERIGVRYLNRIDIPNGDKGVDLEEYFEFSPNIPEGDFPTISKFFCQVAARIDKQTFITLNTSSFDEQPLLNHTSFLLDLDIYTVENIPTDLAGLINRLAELRVIKNRYFENLVKQKAKDLFN